MKQQPWVGKNMENAQRYGQFGEIMPQEEFLVLMQVCDVFELVYLEKGTSAPQRTSWLPTLSSMRPSWPKGSRGYLTEAAEIKRPGGRGALEPLYHMGNLGGLRQARSRYRCEPVRSCDAREHRLQGSNSVLALLHAVKAAGIAAKTDVEYVIDCAEEACGDMNQRGGGGFAKSCC